MSGSRERSRQRKRHLGISRMDIRAVPDLAAHSLDKTTMRLAARSALAGHILTEASERGWTTFKNGVDDYETLLEMAYKTSLSNALFSIDFGSGKLPKE